MVEGVQLLWSVQEDHCLTVGTREIDISVLKYARVGNRFQRKHLSERKAVLTSQVLTFSISGGTGEIGGGQLASLVPPFPPPPPLGLEAAMIGSFLESDADADLYGVDVEEPYEAHIW